MCKHITRKKGSNLVEINSLAKSLRPLKRGGGRYRGDKGCIGSAHTQIHSSTFMLYTLYMYVYVCVYLCVKKRARGKLMLCVCVFVCKCMCVISWISSKVQSQGYNSHSPHNQGRTHFLLWGTHKHFLPRGAHSYFLLGGEHLLPTQGSKHFLLRGSHTSYSRYTYTSYSWVQIHRRIVLTLPSVKVNLPSIKGRLDLSLSKAS